jgi:tRNA 2-thiouridine synthesizing protein A
MALMPRMTDTLLDLRGLKCPLPALKVRKALTRAAAGEVLRVECTDPMAAIDIPHLLNETGDALLARERAEGLLIFRVRKA